MSKHIRVRVGRSAIFFNSSYEPIYIPWDSHIRKTSSKSNKTEVLMFFFFFFIRYTFIAPFKNKSWSWAVWGTQSTLYNKINCKERELFTSKFIFCQRCASIAIILLNLVIGEFDSIWDRIVGCPKFSDPNFFHRPGNFLESGNRKQTFYFLRLVGRRTYYGYISVYWHIHDFCSNLIR